MKVRVTVKQNDLVGSIQKIEKKDGTIITRDRRRPRGSVWWQTYEDIINVQEALFLARKQWPEDKFPGCTFEVKKIA